MRVGGAGAGLVALVAASCLAMALILDAQGGKDLRVELKSSSAIMNWFHTLKGAESFLDDADKGKLPAKAVVPQDFNSVENLLKRTKEQVHREATRLHALDDSKKTKMPYGARKVALFTAPGEKNAEQGMLGLARRDARPGQVMREVTDMVDTYKTEEDQAAKDLLRNIASKIVEAFDAHGLTPAQIAREMTDGAEEAEAERSASAEESEEGNNQQRAMGSQQLKSTGGMMTSGITRDTLLGREGPDVGVQDCTDLPGLPKSSKFCLEGRPYSKLPGLDSAMTTGDMRGKIDALKAEARGNLGLPNSDKVDQEELSKLQDIVKSTKKALDMQQKRLKDIRASKASAMQDLNAQKRIIVMAKDARKQRLAWRHLDNGMTSAYKQAGFKLPL